MARVGLLPQLSLPVRLVDPPPLRPHLWMLANRIVQCFLPLLGVLALVVVALGVTAQLLTMTALLSLGLQVWVRVCGLRLVLPGLARGLVVVLPPAPSGAAKDDHSSTFDSVDLDWDD